MPSPHKEPSLAQLIRRSPVLDAAARRRWLAVLPHLTDEDRARLREILLSDSENDLATRPRGDFTPPTPLSTPERGEQEAG